MTFNGWLQIAIFVLLVIATTKPLGAFMANVFSGDRTFLSPVLRPVERGIYAICGIREDEEQRWATYAISMLLFSLVGMVVLYVIQRLQGMLPLNPQGMSAVSPDSSFNTALSFVSNAEWQGYGGESTMSYLTQMVGITTQEFASPSVGIAVAIALIRGFARRSTTTIGNFWVDITRCALYLLLPLSVVATIVYVWQGAPQNFLSYTSATTLEGAKQLIGQGPVASQEAIKMIGANGGGFFNTNSAHPFENPNALTNLFGLWMIVAIPAGLTYTFGKMVGNVRQGWALFATMGILFLCGQAVCYWAEAQPSDKLLALHVDQAPSDLQAGGNMEGKEVRFGIANSASWAAATTATANGSVNGMLDSFTPLGGLVPMVNIQFGEVAFGGVGSGLYSMLLVAVIAIFIAGLMVGRTPEYLGKKIEAREVKMTMLAILIVPAAILGFTALACILPVGLSSLNNAGPHGFSEILYAFTSVTNNSGSAFAGLSANTPFYNITLGIALFVGRFWFIMPMLAVASSLASKEIVPASSGTLPTDGGLFVGLLIGVVVILTGLTYFSAVSLGPVVEHFAMKAGQLY